MTRATSFAPELELVAASIADGDDLDWTQLEGDNTCDPGTRIALGKLQQISRAFRVDRSKAVSRERQVAFQFAGLDAIEKIAEGGQGEVWRAYDVTLKRDVALKIRKCGSGGLSNNLIEEGRKLAKLHHPNVVRIYGAAVQGNRSGVWMELVKGESMQSKLSRTGPLDAEIVTRVALDLCSALAEIHRQGFAHGDIKPENVMQEENGRTVLIDFGSARKLDHDSGACVSGTRAYVAPEILEGGATKPASDIYALATLMFYLVTARFPWCIDATPHGFQNSSVGTATGKRGVRSRRGRQFSLNSIAPAISGALADLIERGVSRDPARRPNSALDFQAELLRLAQSQ